MWHSLVAFQLLSLPDDVFVCEKLHLYVFVMEQVLDQRERCAALAEAAAADAAAARAALPAYCNGRSRRSASTSSSSSGGGGGCGAGIGCASVRAVSPGLLSRELRHQQLQLQSTLQSQAQRRCAAGRQVHPAPLQRAAAAPAHAVASGHPPNSAQCAPCNAEDLPRMAQGHGLDPLAPHVPRFMALPLHGGAAPVGSGSGGASKRARPAFAAALAPALRFAAAHLTAGRTLLIHDDSGGHGGVGGGLVFVACCRGLLQACWWFCPLV
jgi:hypothetical protein